MRFLDLVTGSMRKAAARHDGAVVRASFAANGRVAATAGADRRVIVWDVEAAAASDVLEGHAGQITSLKISPDGRTLYSSGSDGKLIVWDLAGDRRLGRPFSTSGRRSSAGLAFDLSPDGRVLAAGHGDGSVTLTDVATLREISTFPVVPGRPVESVIFVPGSHTLLVGAEGFLAGVDTREGYRVTPIPGHEGALFLPSISSDGRRMTTVSGSGAVSVWTLSSGLPVGRPRLHHLSAFEDASLSPDGRTLAVLLPGTGIELLDATTLRRGPILEDSEDVRGSARFTEDGRHIVADAGGGWVRIWSVETARPVRSIYVGSTEELLVPVMSPDGRLLATGSVDGIVRLFDPQTGRPLGMPLPGLPNRPVVPLFTPDGAHLLAIPLSGPAYRWDVRPSSWARHACEVAGRTLTRAEFRDALPGREYAPACS